MIKKRLHLKPNAKYHFCIFYGVDIATIEKLKLNLFKIKSVVVFSKEFEELISEVDDLSSILTEELAIFKHYHGQDISILLYSQEQESLDNFYDLTTLLLPSKIGKWLTFDTYYVDYKTNGVRTQQHLSNGYAIWTSIHDLYDNITGEEVFFLLENECSFLNKIISKYDDLKKNTFYTQFMSLYRRAYIEERDYFKYLLLFMIVERLVKDDETTGVVFKIRRLCAILIGTNKTECQMIFDNTKHAYTVRSKLVHSAKNEISSAKYLPFLHSIVCEIGIMILISKLNTDTIFSVANTLGFGQKKELISQRIFKSHSILIQNRLNLRAISKNTANKSKKLSKPN